MSSFRYIWKIFRFGCNFSFVKHVFIPILFLFFSNDGDRKHLLKQLSRMNRPLQISFAEMMKLMSQCQQVNKFGLMIEKHSLDLKDCVQNC